MLGRDVEQACPGGLLGRAGRHQVSTIAACPPASGMRARQIVGRAHLDQARGGALELEGLAAVGGGIERRRLGRRGDDELDAAIVEACRSAVMNRLATSRRAGSITGTWSSTSVWKAAASARKSAGPSGALAEVVRSWRGRPPSRPRGTTSSRPLTASVLGLPWAAPVSLRKAASSAASASAVGRTR